MSNISNIHITTIPMYTIHDNMTRSESNVPTLKNVNYEFASIFPMIFKTITILTLSGRRIMHIVPTASIPCNYIMDDSSDPRIITFCKGRILTNYLGCNDKIKKNKMYYR